MFLKSFSLMCVRKGFERGIVLAIMADNFRVGFKQMNELCFALTSESMKH